MSPLCENPAKTYRGPWPFSANQSSTYSIWHTWAYIAFNKKEIHKVAVLSFCIQKSTLAKNIQRCKCVASSQNSPRSLFCPNPRPSPKPGRKPTQKVFTIWKPITFVAMEYSEDAYCPLVYRKISWLASKYSSRYYFVLGPESKSVTSLLEKKNNYTVISLKLERFWGVLNTDFK